MKIKTFLLAAVLVASASLASCATAGQDYSTLNSGEIQLAGHPYKTAKDCERTAPIGKFDRKCDIPVVGFRGFTDPTIGVQSGGIGGLGVGGL